MSLFYGAYIEETNVIFAVVELEKLNIFSFTSVLYTIPCSVIVAISNLRSDKIIFPFELGKATYRNPFVLGVYKIFIYLFYYAIPSFVFLLRYYFSYVSYPADLPF